MREGLAGIQLVEGLADMAETVLSKISEGALICGLYVRLDSTRGSPSTVQSDVRRITSVDVRDDMHPCCSEEPVLKIAYF